MEEIIKKKITKKELKGQTYWYKEFDPALGVVELNRYKKVLECGINGIDNIVLPVDFDFHEGNLYGYYMRYVEGEPLRENFFTIPFDILIKSVEELSKTYFELAKARVEVSGVEIMDLIYSNGKMINLGIEGLKQAESFNIRMIHMNSLKKLKEPFFKILNSMNLPQEVRNVLVKDSTKDLVTPVKMLEDFKVAVDTAYSTKIKTLSELWGAKNGNKEKSIGSSWPNGGWQN